MLLGFGNSRQQCYHDMDEKLGWRSLEGNTSSRSVSVPSPGSCSGTTFGSDASSQAEWGVGDSPTPGVHIAARPGSVGGKESESLGVEEWQPAVKRVTAALCIPDPSDGFSGVHDGIVYLHLTLPEATAALWPPRSGAATVLHACVTLGLPVVSSVCLGLLSVGLGVSSACHLWQPVPGAPFSWLRLVSRTLPPRQGLEGVPSVSLAATTLCTERCWTLGWTHGCGDATCRAGAQCCVRLNTLCKRAPQLPNRLPSLTSWPGSTMGHWCVAVVTHSAQLLCCCVAIVVLGFLLFSFVLCAMCCEFCCPCPRLTVSIVCTLPQLCQPLSHSPSYCIITHADGHRSARASFVVAVLASSPPTDPRTSSQPRAVTAVTVIADFDDPACVDVPAQVAQDCCCDMLEPSPHSHYCFWGSPAHTRVACVSVRLFTVRGGWH